MDAHRSLELSIFLKNIVLFLNIRLVFLLHGFQDGLRFGNSNNIIIHYFDGFCEVLIYQLEILRCLGVCGLQEGGRLEIEVCCDHIIDFGVKHIKDGRNNFLGVNFVTRIFIDVRQAFAT